MRHALSRDNLGRDPQPTRSELTFLTEFVEKFNELVRWDSVESEFR
jgi:hypothetical protein